MYYLANLNLHGIDLFKDVCSVDVELCCTEDSTSRIQDSFQEREVELTQHNGSEDCAFESESDQSDMSTPRSLSVPGRRERDREKSLSFPGLRRSPAMLRSTPSRPQQIPRAPTFTSSLGENDLTSMTDEQIGMAGIRNA
ncbi:unnamed protein product [Prunus armeniaca]